MMIGGSRDDKQQLYALLIALVSRPSHPRVILFAPMYSSLPSYLAAVLLAQSPMSHK